MKSLTASFYSLFVFWLALQARQNTAQLVKILSDILHNKTSNKIYVFTKFEGRSWTRRRSFIFFYFPYICLNFPANVAYPAKFRDLWKIRKLKWVSSSQVTAIKLSEYNLLPSVLTLLVRNCAKFNFWKKFFCHGIPIQTLQFLTVVPTCQDGFENCD